MRVGIHPWRYQKHPVAPLLQHRDARQPLTFRNDGDAGVLHDLVDGALLGDLPPGLAGRSHANQTKQQQERREKQAKGNTKKQSETPQKRNETKRNEAAQNEQKKPRRVQRHRQHVESVGSDCVNRSKIRAPNGHQSRRKTRTRHRSNRHHFYLFVTHCLHPPKTPSSAPVKKTQERSAGLYHREQNIGCSSSNFCKNTERKHGKHRLQSLQRQGLRLSASPWTTALCFTCFSECVC